MLSQAIAIQQSLCLNPIEELNVSNFLDDLINKMDKIEVDGRYVYNNVSYLNVLCWDLNTNANIDI